MDIDAHSTYIRRLLEFKDWAEAKIAELEARLGVGVVEVAAETVAEPVTDSEVAEAPEDEPVADTPVVVAEEEKAAE